SPRREPGGVAACLHRVRLVRHPDLSRRPRDVGHRRHAGRRRLDERRGGRRAAGHVVDLVRGVLGAATADHLAWHGRRAPFRELDRAAGQPRVLDHDDLRPGQGGRPRADSGASVAAGLGAGVLGGVRPVAEVDDRVLGDVVAEHAGLHPLRRQSAQADARADPRPADHDDVHRDRGRADHIGRCGALRRGDLGPGPARRAVRRAGRGDHLARRAGARHHFGEHRGERGQPVLRLLERLPPQDQFRRRRADHRCAGHRGAAVAAAGQRRRLHQRLAVFYGGVLGAVAGVLISGYWLRARTELQLAELYREKGRYWFSGGWNWQAVVATVIGGVLAVGGAYTAPGKEGPFPEDGLIPFLKGFYDYSWVVGLVAASIVYVLLTAGRNTMRIAEAAPAEGEARA